MELRDYQTDVLAETLIRLDEGQRKILLQMPTSSGKTVVGCALADVLQRQPTKRNILVVTHRRFLNQQWHETLTQKFGAWAYIHTIQQITNPRHTLNFIPTHKDVLILDECHHYIDNAWSTFIESWPGILIGITATPWRREAHQSFRHLYQSIILGPSKKDLIAAGHIVPSKVKSIKFGEIQGKGGNEAGDYSMAATWRYFAETVQRAASVIKQGVDFLQKESPNGKTIIFAMNLTHAESLRLYCQRVGRQSVIVSANTSDAARQAVFESFESSNPVESTVDTTSDTEFDAKLDSVIKSDSSPDGTKDIGNLVVDEIPKTLDTLITVAVLTEGVDLPICDTVLIQRPTDSLVLYLQMVGRAGRLYGNKEYATILEGSGNHARHGHPDDDWYWTLESRSADLRAPKICPECDCVNPPEASKCYECGYPLVNPVGSRDGVPCSICGRLITKLECEGCKRDIDGSDVLNIHRTKRIDRANTIWKLDEDNSWYECYFHALHATASLSVHPNANGEYVGMLRLNPDRESENGEIYTSPVWMVHGGITNGGSIKFGKSDRTTGLNPEAVMDSLISKAKLIHRKVKV